MKDVTPEDAVKIKLSEWLESHGVTVYWEKTPSYGRDVFTSSAGAEKPDLLAVGENLTAALEVKPGDEASAVHDAVPQLHRYWLQHVAGRDEYTVDGETITPDAFLLATQFSPEGRLFEDTDEKDVERTDQSDGRRVAVDRGWLPDVEHSGSETVTRILWRFANAAAEDATIGIGSLYSTALDGDPEAEPAACYYTPKDGYQHWEMV